MIFPTAFRHTDMSTIEAMASRDEIAAATAGDQTAFARVSERYRRELQVHCYRMLGSFEDSEDLVQETFLRAWRRRASFEGRSTFRAWLYRIATNASLDALAKHPRRLPESPGSIDLPWLQPYPDSLLEGLAAPEAGPDEAVVSKETIELAYMVAIQYLPPRQRAVLILRDVLGWPAKDTAELMETSLASVNSALQRARATLKEHLPERRLEWAPGADPSREERAMLERYLEATDRGDSAAFAAMLREDARFAMPPEPGVYVGRDEIIKVWEQGFNTVAFGHMRGVVTRANMQPAVACYLCPAGETVHRALALDVLRFEGGLLADVVTFPSRLFAAFGLPPELSVT